MKQKKKIQFNESVLDLNTLRLKAILCLPELEERIKKLEDSQKNSDEIMKLQITI